jgi:hypothetical protein
MVCLPKLRKHRQLLFIISDIATLNADMPVLKGYAHRHHFSQPEYPTIPSMLSIIKVAFSKLRELGLQSN